MWSAARSAKISMILCMPERVSGGDAKFQGFCHRWNKWEGQDELPLTPLAIFAKIDSMCQPTGGFPCPPETSISPTIRTPSSR